MTINKHEYKVGDRIERTAAPKYQGTIVGFNPAQTIMVKWDDDKYLCEMHNNEFLLVGQSKALSALIQVKINEATNALEDAYKLWQEAKQIAQHDISGFESVWFIDTLSLEKSVENWGWNSSSLYC